MMCNCITGYLIPHCIQSFHRDIQGTIDHFTNKFHTCVCHSCIKSSLLMKISLPQIQLMTSRGAKFT